MSMTNRQRAAFMASASYMSSLKLSSAGAAAPPYDQDTNNKARAYVLANSREMFQQVAQVVPGAPLVGQVINIPLRNVGLVKRLIVRITANVAQGAAENQNLTKWGLSNFCSNINVTDLSNYQRINTTGWHLTALASLRRQGAYGAAFLNDSPVNFGSNFAVNSSPAQITTVKPVSFYYELPMSYSDTDL